ncbi:MAG: prolipoprotein diacylglyceryl transferase [Planctomycetota bacterium]|nr:prolipoprotein diacylglyceryl transferase [Planctomycetota bacterium]
MGEVAFPAWDPVFLDLWGPLDLRYYGLMYVVGFVAGQYILTQLARHGFLPMPREKVGDLIFALILGVVLGGRIGYSLFYKPEIWGDPLQVLKIWEGGLSFHGGLLGVVVAFVYFCRKHAIQPGRVCDSLALAVCPGIFAVRIANFINGELYGRIIRPGDWEPPWAMRFPTDAAVQKYFNFQPGMGKREQELEILKAVEDGRWDQQISQHAPLRHPSQVYEALTEGLILGLILWFAYARSRRNNQPLGVGGYGGIFLIGYGVMRFAIEFFREPDDHFEKDADGLGTILLGLSMGQLLCMGMILVGIYLLFRRRTEASSA